MTASAELARRARPIDIGFRIPRISLETPQRRARILKIGVLRGFLDARIALASESDWRQQTVAIENARTSAREKGGVRGAVTRVILFNSEPLQPKELNSFIK